MYCRKCGFKVEEGDNFCPKCGAALKRGQPKNEGVAALLAFLPGFIGILGMGHMYAGRVGRALVLFFTGIILEGTITALALYYLWRKATVYTGGYSYYLENTREIQYAIGSGLVFLIWLILWIWQTFNARRVCLIYNNSLEGRNQSKS